MPVPPAPQPLDGTSGTAILGCVGRASSAFFSILLEGKPHHRRPASRRPGHSCRIDKPEPPGQRAASGWVAGWYRDRDGGSGEKSAAIHECCSILYPSPAWWRGLSRSCRVARQSLGKRRGSACTGWSRLEQRGSGSWAGGRRGGFGGLGGGGGPSPRRAEQGCSPASILL